jgi:hypothetical protein
MSFTSTKLFGPGEQGDFSLIDFQPEAACHTASGLFYRSGGKAAPATPPKEPSICLSRLVTGHMHPWLRHGPACCSVHVAGSCTNSTWLGDLSLALIWRPAFSHSAQDDSWAADATARGLLSSSQSEIIVAILLRLKATVEKP